MSRTFEHLQACQTAWVRLALSGDLGRLVMRVCLMAFYRRHTNHAKLDQDFRQLVTIGDMRYIKVWIVLAAWFLRRVLQLLLGQQHGALF
jgi:hypothetical protein